MAEETLEEQVRRLLKAAGFPQRCFLGNPLGPSTIGERDPFISSLAYNRVQRYLAEQDKSQKSQ